MEFVGWDHFHHFIETLLPQLHPTVKKLTRLVHINKYVTIIKSKYDVTVKGLWCVHKNILIINRQRDVIFAPNIKMLVDKYLKMFVQGSNIEVLTNKFSYKLFTV